MEPVELLVSGVNEEEEESEACGTPCHWGESREGEEEEESGTYGTPCQWEEWRRGWQSLWNLLPLGRSGKGGECSTWNCRRPVEQPATEERRFMEVPVTGKNGGEGGEWNL